MNNGVNFAATHGTYDLVNRVKGGDAHACDTLAQGLLANDGALLHALQEDRGGALAAIRLLADGARPALFALLARLEIARDDTELMGAAIDAGLGGNAALTHHWIADYDIVGQRLEMIRSVVLPYLDAHCPHKTLFRALKEYEARALALNLPLLDPLHLYAAIDASHSGEPGLAPAPADPGVRAGTTRLVLPNAVFNAVLRLAWTNQEYVFDLCDRYDPEEFVALLGTLDRVVPVYLIPTHLGYPMGGGESFLHQTCRILSEFAVKCVWQSFLDPATGWYASASLTHTPYYIDVRHAGGCSKEAIELAVDEFHPDLIHAQGGTGDVAMEIAQQQRLTTLIGYHFWHGLVDLGASGNKHILDNLDEHKLREGAPPSSRLVHKYVASEFMQEVCTRLGSKEKLKVIHPISDAAQFLAQRDDLGKYVLQVNVVPGKGGGIFLDCVKALGHEIPFMGVQSEPGESGFFVELANEMAARPQCVLTSYGNVREFYRSARIVIVPTLVDETFCRVAFEAAMNGIPVLCTANGYLPSMLGDTGVFLPEDPAEWVDCIRTLYHDEARLRQIGEAQRTRLARMFGSDFGDFIGSAMGLIDNAATRNIGIFTVWGDLGLGNLSHGHARLLRSAGYRVHIFSFQPYAAIGKGLVKQQDPADWSVPENADSVYYSFNHREEVSAYELTQFVLAHDIHTLLVPEVCWQPNWDRLFEMRVNRLNVCSIPMIEIVIREEIPHHNRLSTTFYCTRLSEQALSAAGVHNGAFLGYGQGRPLPPERVAAKRARLAQRPKIRFLHVAGHNPRTRKNTPQVIEAFSKALALRDDIELTVTSMDPIDSYYPGQIPAGITVVDRSLGRNEILDLYEEHDVSIQVSSHEGLGLGFYESISRCTPVLSLDAPPHNEIVLDGETGWLIAARPLPMPDNDRSIVSAWQFDTFALTERILSLRREEIDHVTASSAHVFMKRFDEVAQLTRFLQVLPRSHIVPAALPDAAPVPQPEAASFDSQLAPAVVAAAPATEAAPATSPAPARHSFKTRVKIVLYKALRRGYHLARPLTRRIGQRLRAATVDATQDLRQQMQALSGAQAAQNQELFIIARTLHQEVRTLADSGLRQHKVLADAQREQERGLAGLLREAGARQAQMLARLTGGIDALAQRVDGEQHELGLLRRDVRFMKDRMASYAGPDTVLTYLRDESPLFVNTGDLGCPSPIVNGGVWEPENLDVLLSFVKDDTVFLDVGANVGYFAIAVGNRLGRAGRVHAFEPHAGLAGLIERSVHLNSLEPTVTLWQCAVSDAEGTLDLFYPDRHLGQGTASRDIDVPGKHVTVRSRPVDALLAGVEAVDLVKIDVEGHELPVLRGMQALLRRSPQVKLLFEKLGADDGGNTDNAAIAALLGELGLSLYGVGPNATLVPLDKPGYATWIGDVLAAPAAAVDRLDRRSFSVYPGQLSGAGTSHGALARYQAQHEGIVFFGPDWFLQAGTWELRLHGELHAPLRLVLVEEHERVLAECVLEPGAAVSSFRLEHDVAHVELRASLAAGAAVDLERIAFQRI
ncbi:MAG: FkbM family methyltransferase [Massilia sp.]|nr:FkbM family methyltransferase [Massilia sp.]